MQLRFEDNFELFTAELKKAQTGGNRIHTATVRNKAPFAQYLQDREGFFVFNDARLFRFVKREIRNIENLPTISLLPKYVDDAIERGILKYIEWLRSYTGTTSRPYKGGTGQRKTHPGKWADITGYLNNSYEYRLNGGEWIAKPEWLSGLAQAKAKYAAIYPQASRRLP